MGQAAHVRLKRHFADKNKPVKPLLSIPPRGLGERHEWEEFYDHTARTKRKTHSYISIVNGEVQHFIETWEDIPIQRCGIMTPEPYILHLRLDGAGGDITLWLETLTPEARDTLLTALKDARARGGFVIIEGTQLSVKELIVMLEYGYMPQRPRTQALRAAKESSLHSFQ